MALAFRQLNPIHKKEPQSFFVPFSSYVHIPHRCSPRTYHAFLCQLSLSLNFFGLVQLLHFLQIFINFSTKLQMEWKLYSLNNYIKFSLLSSDFFQNLILLFSYPFYSCLPVALPENSSFPAGLNLIITFSLAVPRFFPCPHFSLF